MNANTMVKFPDEKLKKNEEAKLNEIGNTSIKTEIPQVKKQLN
jgi:hypothetical protein